MSSRNQRTNYQPRSTSSTTTYVLAGVAVAVIAALVIGGVLWNSQRSTGGADEKILNDNAALVVGNADAGQTIDVFEDFLCPVCKQFEQESGTAITKAVNDGKLRVRYHMLNFLDDKSASTNYSSRAAGAAQCVGDAESRTVFEKFHTDLFAQQPEEGGSTDLTNGDLARIAKDAGAGEGTQKCVADGASVSKAQESAKQSETQLAKANNGQVSTPTVLSGGEVVPDALGSGTGWLDRLLADKG